MLLSLSTLPTFPWKQEVVSPRTETVTALCCTVLSFTLMTFHNNFPSFSQVATPYSATSKSSLYCDRFLLSVDYHKTTTFVSLQSPRSHREFAVFNSHCACALFHHRISEILCVVSPLSLTIHHYFGVYNKSHSIL